MGLPRSGSTLVEQMLSTHTMVWGAGEKSYEPRRTGEKAQVTTMQPYVLRYTVKASILIGYTLQGHVWLPGSVPEEFSPLLTHSGEDTALAPLTPEVNQVLSKQGVNHREELGRLVGERRRGCEGRWFDELPRTGV